MNLIERYAYGIFLAIPELVRHRCIIGGGCFRSLFDFTPVKDIDLFFRSYEDYEWVRSFFVAEGAQEMTDSPTTELMFNGMRFNLIHFAFSDVDKLIENFDFLHCAIAATWDKGFVLASALPDAISAAQRRELVPLTHQRRDRAERRCARYMGYGYTMHPQFWPLWSNSKVDQRAVYEEFDDA